MVKSAEVGVAVVCIPLEMPTISASPSQSFVPFDTAIYGVVRRSDTKEGENGVKVYLYRRIPEGWVMVGETTSERKYDQDGWCEVKYRMTEEKEETFTLANIGDKYCAFRSLPITVRGLKKATHMTIMASPSNPAPDQPYLIYGFLKRTEPDEKYLNDKTVKLYESGDGGATWNLIATLKTRKTIIAGEYFDGYWEKKLSKTEDTWKYYAEFEGDAEYRGCGQGSGPTIDYGPVYF